MPKTFLPFLLLQSKGLPRPQPRSQPLAFTFSLLLTAFCILLSPSCKDIGVPPDRIIPDTTSHGPDTTSHDFVWTIDTLGDGSGGTLYDVAIINDTLAYAVGEIYLKDSSGQIDPLPYNAAVWNGSMWTIKRISVSFNGNTITLPLEGVFVFSPGDIWVVGSFPIHGNGNSWTLYHLQNMGLSVSVSRAWGTGSSNMYFVGRQGSIAHFDGSMWTKIESGTTLDFQDVWGHTNAGLTSVLAVASVPFGGPQRYIARITSTAVTAVSDSGITQPLNGVWFIPDQKYYVVGSGVFWKDSLDDNQWGKPVEPLTQFYSNAVRGTDTSNVFVVGAFVDILHYNGSTWKSYPELLGNDASLYGLDAKGKLVIAVGFAGDQPLIIRGVNQ